MIMYDESLAILKKMSVKYPHTQTETIQLNQSVGRILAEDIVAAENNPPFDNSAMDGFAVNVAALDSESERSGDWIPVQTLISAGDSNISVKKVFSAIQIMTGAPIPDAYFDSVVRVEDVEQKKDGSGNEFIRLKTKPKIGDNIRRKGEDTKIGDILFTKGMRISNEHLLSLATQGIYLLKVKKAISVGILSTGKEIVPHDTKELRPGQIRNSTGVYLEAATSVPSLKVRNCGIIQDDPDLYVQELKKIFDDDCDILISTGAVSMGVHDFVRPVLENLGAEIHFHKCAIRPGKPVLFASLNHKGRIRFIFGVPGNPVSTAVGFKFFVKPFLDFLLLGSTEIPIKAILDSDTKKPEGLKCFFKAKVDFQHPETRVEALQGQASFMVSPLIRSNAWVVFPESGTIVRKGTKVEVYTL